MYNIENKIEAIKEVQRLLGINQTGTYDEKTTEAVNKIQKSYNLTQTGITDYVTFKAILVEYKTRNLINDKDISILFNPDFPYALGDFDGNVGHINSVIRDIFTDYTIESKLPFGNYYGKDTENAVIQLRKIFMMNESAGVDAPLFKRMIMERDAIELKKRIR